jgi:hypothetical protein
MDPFKTLALYDPTVTGPTNDQEKVNCVKDLFAYRARRDALPPQFTAVKKSS